MRICLSFALCLLIAGCFQNFSFAQDKPIYFLKGYLGVQGGESFHYDIELKDSTNNLLTGYAYTYDQPGKDVKAAIVVAIDRTNKTIQINESDIIYNKGFTSKAVICLLETFLKWEKPDQLKGTILTKIDGGAGLPCSKGSLTFSNEKEIVALFDGIQQEKTKTDTVKQAVGINKPRIDSTKPKVYIDKTQSGNTAKENKVIIRKREITEGKDEVLQWETDKIELHIWDGTAIDGDRVTVLLNGDVVLNDYAILKEPHKILLSIGANEMNIITIIANNEGAEPPNTANLLLKDGEKEYPILAYNTIGKKAIIKIKKVIK